MMNNGESTWGEGTGVPMQHCSNPNNPSHDPATVNDVTTSRLTWLCEHAWSRMKPEAFQDIVESVSPGPYLELFARRKRLGWASWGNEIASDVEIPNMP